MGGGGWGGRREGRGQEAGRERKGKPDKGVSKEGVRNIWVQGGGLGVKPPRRALRL